MFISIPFGWRIFFLRLSILVVNWFCSPLHRSLKRFRVKALVCYCEISSIEFFRSLPISLGTVSQSAHEQASSEKHIADRGRLRCDCSFRSFHHPGFVNCLISTNLPLTFPSQLGSNLSGMPEPFFQTASIDKTESLELLAPNEMRAVPTYLAGTNKRRRKNSK